MYLKEISLVLFPLALISLGMILSLIVDESGSVGMKENSSLIMPKGMLGLVNI